VHALAGWLAANPEVHAKVDGHADALGEPFGNLALSQRRARAVRWLLVAGGARSEQLTMRWFGAFHPLDDTRVESAENRRVEVGVLGARCPPDAPETP
jgi:outer membrane protein OmpA-like peptidoglycan-associated protein